MRWGDLLMPKVLVTGGDSFTAQHLIPTLLSSGFDCHSTHLSRPDNKPNRHLCDITDCLAVEKIIKNVEPDYIIHLAGISFVGHPRPIEHYNVNVLATENLLKISSKYLPNVKKIILASSANVYGRSKSTFIDEDVCPFPVNHYAASKLAMEHMAAAWMNRLPMTIVRPFNYTGRGQNTKYLVPKIVSHFAERQSEIKLGNIDVARDFTDVRVICDYYLKLLLAENADGETINLCSGRLTSLSSILEATAKITGHKIDIKVDPKFVRQSEILQLRGNPEKLHKLIGVQAHPTIEDTINWML